MEENKRRKLNLHEQVKRRKKKRKKKKKMKKREKKESVTFITLWNLDSYGFLQFLT